MNNNNTISNVILDDTYYLSDERMDNLVDMYASMDTPEYREEEAAPCNTLNHEGECECTHKAKALDEYDTVHGTGMEGMLIDIAIKAYYRTKDEDSARSIEVFEKGKAFLDKIESEYTPGVDQPLTYRAYKLAKAFRARLNLFRYKPLYILNYEQWAYLTNWLNVLTSWKNFKTGEIKQYNCEAQGIIGDKPPQPKATLDSILKSELKEFEQTGKVPVSKDLPPIKEFTDWEREVFEAMFLQN